MEASNPTQQLFDLWRRQIEEGTQAWSKMVTQPSGPTAPDPLAFWRPFMDQGLASWARVMGQVPVSPDLTAQWKRFLDEWIEAWSRALSRSMGTEAFAEMLGRYLDQWLVAQGPLKKSAQQTTDAMLQTLDLPSRTQVANVARQLVELEERMERLEDGLAALLARSRAGGLP